MILILKSLPLYIDCSSIKSFPALVLHFFLCPASLRFPFNFYISHPFHPLLLLSLLLPLRVLIRVLALICSFSSFSSSSFSHSSSSCSCSSPSFSSSSSTFCQIDQFGKAAAAVVTKKGRGSKGGKSTAVVGKVAVGKAGKKGKGSEG